MAKSDLPADSSQESGIPLDELQLGRCGFVVKVDSESDEVKRLMAMGVCAGRIIKLEQLGDPMILQVMGSKIGVSKRLGTTVSVIPCEVDDCAYQKESDERNR